MTNLETAVHKRLDGMQKLLDSIRGFGWTRWSRQWLYDTLKLFNGYQVRWPQLKVAPAINLGTKQAGERKSGKSASCVRRGGDWKRGMVAML